MGAYAVMNEGKLVWSRKWPDGSWWAYSADDEDGRVYVAQRHPLDTKRKRWQLIIRTWADDKSWRLDHVNSAQLTLREVKRLADEHHHECIKNSTDPEHQGLRDYIERYPLT